MGLGSLSSRGRKRLVRWLSDRQCVGGGLNGRPGKAPDACYTWWTLASAELLRSRASANIGASPTSTTCQDFPLSDLFRLAELRAFLAQCAAPEGGVAAHPGDDPDPFHTFFGLAGLALTRSAKDVDPWLGRLNPLVALPD